MFKVPHKGVILPGHHMLIVVPRDVVHMDEGTLDILQLLDLGKNKGYQNGAVWV